MEDYRLQQSGQEVQDILNGAAMQVDLTAETQRAELAETTLQGNIDIEERDRKAADVSLQSNIDAEELRAKAAEKQNADDIDAIEEKIPSGASSSNKLATEDYVNDKVTTDSATFRGTYNLVSDLGLLPTATHDQIAYALSGEIATSDNNDYAFVQIPTSVETPTEIAKIERYKFNGTAWAFEYELNNSGFTSDQWAAINSGITGNDVTKLAALPTSAQLTALLAGKQDVLTFDSVPTQESNNPVKSGGVYSAIDDEKVARQNSDAALQQSIEAILLLIPSAATSLNQLADKAFVNSSIATSTATFRGTYNLVSDLHLTLDATRQQIATALAGAIATADNNDYAFIQVPTSEDTPAEIAKTDRYKFNGEAWAFEYELNNSGFTATQWAAINSGITQALVTKLSALPTNADLTTALGVLTDGIAVINAKIPAEATTSNKLVDTTAMQSYIAQVLDTIDATFNITSTDGHVTVQITQADGVITSVAVTTSDIASDADLTILAGRVTTAEGNISTNADDIAALQAAYSGLTQSNIVVGALPSSGQQQNIIYRQPDQDHTPPQFYSDYMWNGTTWVLMATYNNAIDPRPKKDSQNLVTSGGVFDNMGALDVSDLNATENPHTLATYADLSAALAAIPSDYQKGGMSIKFVLSSDNKYVQYRLMSNSFNTTVANWQGVDDEPTVDSNNLVKSGAVFSSVQTLQLKRLNNQTVTTRWTKVFYNLPAGTTIYYKIHSLIPNVTNIAFAKNDSWTEANILLPVNGQIPRYGSITLDSSAKYFGLLFYSAPSSYSGLNIEVSLNPMYDSLMGEIADVNNRVVTNLNGENIITYYTPLFKGLKAGTNIYTYLKAQPSSVQEGQIAIVKRNAWASDAILGVLTLGKPTKYTLSEDCDTVGLRFYNSNITSFVGLDLDISFSPYYNKVEDVAKYVDFPEYTETTITVDINGSGSFTSIREAVKSITDATEEKRYIVFVKNGTYNEIDIVTKSYVNIVGESRDGVVIYTDGNSNANSPSDYHFSNYANMPINQIPVNYKHLLWHCSKSTVSNMTMIIDNCKYVVHQDESTGAYVATVKDCVLKRIGSNEAGILVGAGLRHGQYIEYVSCDFITTVSNYHFQDFSLAVFAHNLANDNGKCGVTIKDCDVYNCHITQFNDLGSPNQQSIVVVDNVHVDSDFYGILINGTDGVALTTKLEIKNCKPNFVLLTETAISYFKNALNPYTMSVCQASENIQLGQPVSVNRYGSIVPVGIAGSSEEFVIALENINSGNIGYVSTGNIGLALAEAGTYVQGDDLYIYNGKFTKTVHGEKVAFVMRGKTLDSDGMLRICKLL